MVLGLRGGRHFKKTNLPNEAITGLKRVVIELNKSPRELQNEADKVLNATFGYCNFSLLSGWLIVCFHQHSKRSIK